MNPEVHAKGWAVPRGITAIVFLSLAAALSYLAMLLPSLPVTGGDLRELFVAAGPLLAGLIGYAVFRVPSAMNILGRRPGRALALLSVVFVTFVATSWKISPLKPICFALIQLAYCFGEEFGWRHFLLSNLEGTRRWIRPFAMGSIWLAWHFAWMPAPTTAMLGSAQAAPPALVLLCVFLALAFASWMLSWCVKSTGALMPAVLIHFAIKTNLPTLAIATVGTLVWVYMCRKDIQERGDD